MLATCRFVRTPDWSPNRSRSYGEGEVQVRAELNEPGPR